MNNLEEEIRSITRTMLLHSDQEGNIEENGQIQLLSNDQIFELIKLIEEDRQAFKEQVLKEAELYSFTDVGPVDIAPSISIQDLKEILERISTNDQTTN